MYLWTFRSKSSLQMQLFLIQASFRWFPVTRPPPSMLCMPTIDSWRISPSIFCPLSLSIVRLFASWFTNEIARNHHHIEGETGDNWQRTHSQACVAIGSTRTHDTSQRSPPSAAVVGRQHFCSSWSTVLRLKSREFDASAPVDDHSQSRTARARERRTPTEHAPTSHKKTAAPVPASNQTGYSNNIAILYIYTTALSCPKCVCVIDFNPNDCRLLQPKSFGCHGSIDFPRSSEFVSTCRNSCTQSNAYSHKSLRTSWVMNLILPIQLSRIV